MTSLEVKQPLSTTSRYPWFANVIRWLSIGLILASLLLIMRSLPIGSTLDTLKAWIGERGVWGQGIFVLLYVIATVLFVPGTLLTLAAGAMFGLGGGMITVSLGSTLGASLAFLIARYLARHQIAALAKRNRSFGAIDRAIAEGGWKIVVLLRLSPAIPFNLQNYLYGLTAIRFWPYVIASWLAMLPGTLLYVYLGHITGAALDADRERTPAEWLLLAFGLLATIVVTVYITRLARRQLRKQISDTTNDDHSESPPDDENHRAGQPSLRNTLLLAVAAVILTGIAGYMNLVP